MSVIKANGAGSGASGFYNGVATQSLRLDNSASSLLTRTPSAGDRKTWTWSAWIKRCDTGRDQDFFTAEGSGAQLFAIMITSGDQIQIYAASAVLLLSNQLLRDTSAWYHIVVKSDTTQGTASDRLKIYLNGSEVTSFATDNRGSYAQNTDYGINSNVKHNIGSNQAGGNFGDYYIAEVNFVDGTAYDASYFGETKNGVWIPKKYTGSYGTQGFRLEFKQTGDGSSTASSSTIGADTSGNGNHYKDTNLDAHDSNMPDSPENNFATLNPLYYLTASTHLSEGNLQLTHEATAHRANAGTMFSKTGKWYFEVRNKTDTSSSSVALGVGLQDIRKILTYSTGDNNYIYYCNNNSPLTSLNTTTNSLGSFVAGAGDIMQVAYDADSGKLFIGKNNTYVAADSGTDGNPATGANPTATLSTTIDYIPFVGTYNNEATANFGQDDTFAGAISSAGNTDGNGIGAFKYAPPSGFLALCSSNLPEPTISPNADTIATDHFETILYSASSGSAGAGSSTAQDIGGLDFKPDWVWIKGRSYADAHALFDSSRGVGKYLLSNATNAEGSVADTLDEFRSDGFGLGADSTALVNYQNNTYVAWNWKANGGTTSSNSDGSITSTVQANTTAGFSIVLYAGSESNATVGHGLGGVPDWLIWKKRNGVNDWVVYHSANTSEPATDHLHLNNTNATGDAATFFQDTLPTSTVFSIGTDDDVNDAKNYIVFCFRSIEGYSKFGSYTGNGNADGAFVYLGFRPAFIMLKCQDDASSWNILDNKRDPDNTVNQYILPSSADAEGTLVQADFLSNGIKFRTTNAERNGTRVILYMAFAEAPFKYANAR